MHSDETANPLTLVRRLPMIPFMSRANRFYLVRHGQAMRSRHLPIYGHTDVDLKEVGLIQTEHLAEKLWLANIKAIYCSPKGSWPAIAKG